VPRVSGILDAEHVRFFVPKVVGHIAHQEADRFLDDVFPFPSTHGIGEIVGRPEQLLVLIVDFMDAYRQVPRSTK
jgi:hypothetical protein